MSRFSYCPYCGKIQGSINNICVYCFSAMGMAKSQYECEYYESKSLEKYGDYTHTYDFLKPEIESNPFFNQKAPVYSTPHNNTEANSSRLARNVPKCPTCGSTNIEKISGVKRAASEIMFGIFSPTIGKTFCCKNCGYRW